MNGSTSQPEASALGRVVRNSAWLLAAQIVSAILLLCQMTLLTRALGVSAFGTFALVVTIAMTVIQFCDFRVWETIIKYVPYFESRGETQKAVGIVQLCLLIEAVTGLLAFSIIFAAAPWIREIFSQTVPDVAYLRLVAWIAVLNILHEPLTAMLRLANQFHCQAAYRCTLAAARLAASAFVWWHAPSVANFLLAELTARAVGVLVLLPLGCRAARKMNLAETWTTWSVGSLSPDQREVAGFLALGTLTGNMRLITSKADTLILGYFSIPATVGVYELAKRLVEQLSALATPLAMAIFPETSRYVAEGRDRELRRLHRSFSKHVAALVIPGCALVAILAPWFLPMIFGAEYTRSTMLLQILVWQLLWLPFAWFSGYILAKGRLRIAAAINAADALLYIAVLLVLCPWYGATGAAVATTLRYFVWLLMVRLVLYYESRDVHQGP